MKPEIILFVSDHHGIYVPKVFAECVKKDCVTGVKAEDWAVLEEGPDHEWYWETWDDVMRDAVLTDPTNGVKYHVEQDGDCWLIPEGMEWNDAKGGWGWPDENQEDEDEDAEEEGNANGADDRDEARN